MRRTIHLSLGLFMLGGCAIKESSLGDLPESDGTAGEMASSSGTSPDDWDTHTVTGVPTDGTGALGGVGANCELSFHPESRLLELDSPDCASGMCLYPDEETAPWPRQDCEHDDDCGDQPHVWCDPTTNQCALDPTWVDERSMCTAFCETADDCVGVEGTSCEGGFTCGPMASLGPACCRKVCICNDSTPFFDTLLEQCEAGTQPGCCDQDPLPEACGA